MKLTWPWSKPPQEPVQRLVVNPEATSRIHPVNALASSLRRRSNGVFPEQLAKRGMWVWHSGAQKVGILLNVANGMAKVMFVDPVEGTNVVELDVPDYELRQAHFQEIPAKRRPDEDLAHKLGYGRKV